MIDAEALRARVISVYPQADVIGEKTVRFFRQSHGQRFAVCYLDVSGEIPGSEELLTKYLDDLIGPRYYEGSKSLQWNNYFYFILPEGKLGSDLIENRKKVIEADRKYARKYVISESEIDQVLSPPVLVSTSVSKAPSVFSVWTQALFEAGLDSVVLSDDDMPTRLEKIENPVSEVATTNSVATSLAVLPAFIRNFEICNFRPYPVRQDFQFGAVNLIFGANATGKTSLLEAIELFYCGRNNRNADRTQNYELKATFVDGREETATPDRNLSEFRQRNLAWYGQAEVKTNNLYQSFAKFNFLNTDAAVDISNSTSKIEDDLSKLLVGPDASQVWQAMLRVSEAVNARLRESTKLMEQIRGEISEIVQSVLSAEVHQQSTLLEESLRKGLRRYKWLSEDRILDEEAAGQLASSLAELSAAASQASALGWVSGPVTLQALNAFVSNGEAATVNIANALYGLQELQDSMREYSHRLYTQQSNLQQLQDLKKYVDAGVVDRHNERQTIQGNINRLVDLLAGIDLNLTAGLLNSDEQTGDQQLQALIRDLGERESRAMAALEKSDADYKRFAKLRETSFNLQQQLRQLANELLQGSSVPDECPLCHTVFAPGELERHIASDAHDKYVAAGEALLNKRSEDEIALKIVREKTFIYRRLLEFVLKAGLAVQVSLKQSVAALMGANDEYATSHSRLLSLNQEIVDLESKGLSFGAIDQSIAKLAAAGVSVAPADRETIAGLILRCETEIEHLTAILKRGFESAEKGNLGTAKMFPNGVSQGDMRVELSQYKERIAVTKEVVQRLTTLLKTFPWSPESQIAEIVLTAQSARAVASDLRVALGMERQNREQGSRRSQRHQSLLSQEKELDHRIGKFQKAQATLQFLIKDHSLQAATEAALQQNRVMIESIFMRIHSPHEFVGLGSAFSSLRRIGGEEAELNQISTGQRAAFALSIFLAQNSRLVGAPPVMLIDDPIAHIDDFNALSFLDYLRDLAISGRRQIFFATANDKIASLFERKFDFLGDDFSEIRLDRNGSK